MQQFEEQLLDATIEIEGRSVTVRDLLYIEEMKLSEEFAGQASRYGYLGMLTMQAEAELLRAKAEVSRVSSEADLDIRKDYKRQNEKYTEGVIRSEVALDDAVIAAEEAEIKAIERFHLLRAVTDAMKQRGDMMISLGATLRNEMDVTNAQLKDMKAVLKKGKSDEN